MRCIRWFVLVAVGSLAGGCLSMIIPEHHAIGAVAGVGADDLGSAGTGGSGATGATDGGTEADGGGP